jgi:hypothetical protein
MANVSAPHHEVIIKSIMTGPAIQVGLFFLVTFDAKSHVKIRPLQPVHGFHSPMAGFAFNFLADVPLVVKHDMFGQIIDFNPGGWRFGFKIVMYF